MFVNLQLIQFDSGASDFPTPHFAVKPLLRTKPEPLAYMHAWLRWKGLGC